MLDDPWKAEGGPNAPVKDTPQGPKMLRRLSRKGSTDAKVILAKFLDFIDSPIWALPIASFIEQRSVVFDRQQGDVGLYEGIHKEFSELVDTLVECFCADANIPLDSLRQALKNAEADKLTLRQKTTLEPVAAAENFNVFVPMMMRKNVELQLQALQMIEFMCGLIPSVLQIEEGETLKNKARMVTPEETERYVLIAVMRQSKEEFDHMTRAELEELEEVLRSSEMEKQRLELERRKEQEILARALTLPGKDAEGSTGKPEVLSTHSVATAAKSTENTPGNSSATVVSPTKAVKEAVQSEPTTSNEEKPVRTVASRKERRESVGDPPPSVKSTTVKEKDRRQSMFDRSSTPKAGPPADNNPDQVKSSVKKSNGRPPTAKRAGAQAGDGRAALKSASVKERRPSTEARKRKEEAGGAAADNGKSCVDQVPEDSGVAYGPRGKNIYDVNALLREPSRLNSATIRSREEYLRMQRDRLLAMKASEREKQMNDVSQRAAQERPRTAKAARGLMRGGRGSIESDEVLAARRAIVEQLKTQMDGPEALDKNEK